MNFIRKELSNIINFLENEDLGDFFNHLADYYILSVTKGFASMDGKTFDFGDEIVNRFFYFIDEQIHHAIAPETIELLVDANLFDLLSKESIEPNVLSKILLLKKCMILVQKHDMKIFRRILGQVCPIQARSLIETKISKEAIAEIQENEG